jgi:hypothetical protein
MSQQINWTGWLRYLSNHHRSICVRYFVRDIHMRTNCVRCVVYFIYFFRPFSFYAVETTIARSKILLSYRNVEWVSELKLLFIMLWSQWKETTRSYIALEKSNLFLERVKNNHILKLWSISFDLVAQRKFRIVIKKLGTPCSHIIPVIW